MKFCWLQQQGNPDCLLFFAGWGMCPEPFYTLPAGPVDVLMVYDYRKMEPGRIASVLTRLQEHNPPYQRLHLLAWSMGVWAAAFLLDRKKIPLLHLTSAIALGGTCQPVQDRLGLPEQHFAAMAEQLSPARVAAFQHSMFSDKEEAKRFSTAFQKGKRSVTELQQELLALATASAKQPGPPDIYTSKIITGRDRIFPARNQIRAWGRKQSRTLSLPHFPFYHWSNWAAMVEALT